jgi:hypothetical protein
MRNRSADCVIGRLPVVSFLFCIEAAIISVETGMPVAVAPLVAEVLKT